jgi:hypothetical protein
MTESPTPEALAAEFNIFMERAGLTIPPDRLPALLTGYADLLAQLPLLRQPRTAAAEPSNVFRLAPVVA